MWTRLELKQSAKTVLRRNYWKAFVISLVVAFATNIGSSSSGSNIGSSISRSINNSSSSNYYHQEYNSGTTVYDVYSERATVSPSNNIIQSFSYTVIDNIATLIIGAIGLALVVGVLLFRILLGYHLEVGGRKFFIQAAQGEDNMSYLGWFLKRERYKNVIKVMFFRSLHVFLWSLLCVIPGIIKSYAYIFVPYILADNPDMDYKRALELSQYMTNGHKFDIWVLELSFIGWQLLGMLLCCVGGVFVNPYVNATHAELYLRLRQNAIDTGLTAESELNIRMQ